MEIATEAILYAICRRLRERGDEAVTGADNSKTRMLRVSILQRLRRKKRRKTERGGLFWHRWWPCKTSWPGWGEEKCKVLAVTTKHNFTLSAQPFSEKISLLWLLLYISFLPFSLIASSTNLFSQFSQSLSRVWLFATPWTNLLGLEICWWYKIF